MMTNDNAHPQPLAALLAQVAAIRERAKYAAYYEWRVTDDITQASRDIDTLLALVAALTARIAEIDAAMIEPFAGDDAPGGDGDPLFRRRDWRCTVELTNGETITGQIFNTWAADLEKLVKDTYGVRFARLLMFSPIEDESEKPE